MVFDNLILYLSLNSNKIRIETSVSIMVFDNLILYLSLNSNKIRIERSIDYLHKQLGDYSIQATMDKYRDFIP